ncbi:MAG TPA: glycosyltransferase [Gemmatimonadales bacterium]|nr:glycosyltransferase [Gemmatimonadales bacterium]
MHRVLLVSHRYVASDNRGKARALAARGLEVTVAVPQRWREPVLGRMVETSWERQAGVEVFPVQTAQPGDVVRYRFAGRVLGSLLRDKRPELIQIEEELGTQVTRQVAKAAARFKIPVFVGVADNVSGNRTGDRDLFAGFRRRRLLRHVRGVVAASENAAALVRADRNAVHAMVIPHLGVKAPTHPEHHDHEGMALGFVGRLVHRKGLDTLLEALTRHRELSWTLTVVGDGPAREELEALASARRLAARIRWMGAISPADVTKTWPLLDVFIQPSRQTEEWSEPTGHTLAEAMANEVAVIGTASGATAEVIGDAGLVVPPDDPDALAKAIGGMADPEARWSYAEAARARALAKFSDDAVAELTRKFWEEVVR